MYNDYNHIGVSSSHWIWFSVCKVCIYKLSSEERKTWPSWM